MATINKCDKCGKIIKSKDEAESLDLSCYGCYALREKYNLISRYNLCSVCSPALVKQLAKFFHAKKGKQFKK